ncbi:MAG TPA: hypothetical protein EYH45_00725 [Candidatus Caldiarchaeum subterraneum]|uniref:Uncharacterized protein n=1 Tax=Caldiarchaeum subterraneum TaxID=311458 RepID=A0A832ZV14_CALS0|nr:hypothetical protein [Candidatus Caldarchaeum subterraneum]
MPRFYVFSFIISALMGVILYRMLETGSPSLVTAALLTFLTFLLVLNEKKAILENRLGKRIRRLLTYMGLAFLIMVWVITLINMSLFM